MEEGPGFHRSSGGQFKEGNRSYYFNDGDTYYNGMKENSMNSINKLGHSGSIFKQTKL